MKRTIKVGFTLIELLVVIAIIAILAAILFPVFAKVREKARQTSCLSNQKQIGLALTQYLQDFDETFPCGKQYGAGKGWAGEIYPYVKSTSLFLCPDDQSKPDFYISTYYVNSYGYNRSFIILPSGAPQRAQLSTMVAPAKSVLLFEIVNNAAQIDNGNGTIDGDSCTGFGNTAMDGYGKDSTINGGKCLAATGYMGVPAITTAPSAISPTGRHSDGSNFLMADGHAKWLRPASVSPGMSAKASGDAQGANTTNFGGTPFATAAGTDVTTFAATFSLN